MYKIAVVGGPAEKYVSQCLNSLVNQSLREWQACIVLDPSGDNTMNEAATYIKKAQDPRLTFIINNRKAYALPNLLKAFKAMSPNDEDILLTVDADDWLNGPDSLSIVDRYYKRFPQTLITYGSWIPYPNSQGNTNNQPYAEEDFKNIRKVSWRASHLRTFSYKLWKRIKDEDLRDEKGDYFRSAWDLAIIWPMLEMAGYSRSRYIGERVYIYNQETPYNDSKQCLKEQMRYADYITSLKPYECIENL